jgi:glycosyltransferase involved in cell wall biosynthesis/O-antigen/teichoic acid export membrane protein
MVSGVRWLAGATIAVSLLNYVYSLGLTHLLDVGDFAMFAAGQALLLTAGTVSSASVPWVLSQAIVKAETPLARRQAMWFSIITNACLGLVAGGLLTVLALRFAPPPTAAVLGGATFLVFLSSSTIGLLQGERRFGLLGGLRVGDVLLKIAAGLTLVALGTGALGAFAGFAAGSVLLVAAGVVIGRRDLRPAAGAMRVASLWRAAGGVGAVQTLLSVLAAVDLVLVAVLAPAADAATYQASMILSRVPLFLAAAVSATVFPLVVRDRAAGAPLLRTAVRVYVLLVVPYAVALMTVPDAVLALVFPPEYSGMGALLPITAAAGVLIGGVELLTTFFQATRRYTPSVVAQGGGLVVHLTALVLGAAWGGVRGLAIGAVIGAGASLLALAVAAPSGWRASLRPPGSILLGCAAFGGVLVLLAGRPVAWLVVAAVVGIGTAAVALGRIRDPDHDGWPQPNPTSPDGHRLRILHLGFQDWRKPGSGGGAARTREVDSRLAQRHDVTLLVSSYRGARRRVEDGVTVVPVGLPLGYWGGILSYFALLPLAIRRHDADVVVEDFAAPIGSMLPHLFTRRPLVAVVQWLNAEEKSQQYHLPFHRVQRLGVRRHTRYVAMSEDLADRIRQGNPTAEVTVIPNGVPPAAFDVAVPRGDDIVYLGRLEIAQKGLDLLVTAFAAVADRLPGDLVLAGDGPDRRALERQASRAGVADRVHFVGRVDGADKLDLLAGARLVAMPSRFETFGMVAAEALACGTPVVAFEIPSLREVVVPQVGVLVPAFDTDAFAAALVSLAADPERIERMGRAGREVARRYEWRDIALQQEQVYLSAARA